MFKLLNKKLNKDVIIEVILAYSMFGTLSHTVIHVLANK